VSPAVEAAQQQQQQVQQLQQHEVHAAIAGRRVSPKLIAFSPRSVIVMSFTPPE
jgi:hypothetical protein